MRRHRFEYSGDRKEELSFVNISLREQGLEQRVVTQITLFQDVSSQANASFTEVRVFRILLGEE